MNISDHFVGEDKMLMKAELPNEPINEPFISNNDEA